MYDDKVEMTMIAAKPIHFFSVEEVNGTALKVSPRNYAQKKALHRCSWQTAECPNLECRPWSFLRDSVHIHPLSLKKEKKYWLIRERGEEGEKGRHQFVVLLIYALIDWFLYVSWLTTLVYWDDTPGSYSPSLFNGAVALRHQPCDNICLECNCTYTLFKQSLL